MNTWITAATDMLITAYKLTWLFSIRFSRSFERKVFAIEMESSRGRIRETIDSLSFIVLPSRAVCEVVAAEKPSVGEN
jgi:hypothetical protein